MEWLKGVWGYRGEHKHTWNEVRKPESLVQRGVCLYPRKVGGRQ